MLTTALRSLLLAGIAALLAPALGAADPLPGPYVLTAKSSALVGCLDLCDCLLEEVPNLTGRFSLSLRETGATFTRFAVDDVAWILPTDPPLAVRGEGTFEVRLAGAEWVETFELSLSVGDEAPQLFRSPARVRTETADEIVSDVRPAELVCYGQVFQLRAARSEDITFVRGDCNADASIDISDAISLLLRLFAGGPEPSCEAACDANDDARLDIADALAVLGHLFAASGDLPAPFGACGPDPTAGGPDCLDFPPCRE